MLVTAAAVTAASYCTRIFRGRRPGPTFLYLQALFDVLLINRRGAHDWRRRQRSRGPLRHPGGGDGAADAPPNAGLVTLFAGLVYFADVFWGHSRGFGQHLDSAWRICAGRRRHRVRLEPSQRAGPP